MENRLKDVSGEALTLYANTLPDTRIKVLRIITELLKGTQQTEIARMFDVERQYVYQIKYKYIKEVLGE